MTMRPADDAPRSQVFGVWSLVCGISAWAAFLALMHIAMQGVIWGGVLLGWFEGLGLVRTPQPGDVAVWKSSSVLALNDANAVLWLTWLAFSLAFLALLFACRAELAREPSLYSGAGFIIATAGMGLMYSWAMLVCQLMGGVALLAIRRRDTNIAVVVMAKLSAVRVSGEPATLVLVKLLHTLVWVVFVACILAIPVASWLGWHEAAAWFSAFVFMEVLVLLLNQWTCPMTGWAARYTDARRPNFDIYLPEWLAKYNKHIFGTLYVLGMVFALVHWATHLR